MVTKLQVLPPIKVKQNILAVKCVKQRFSSNTEITQLMDTFRKMVNDVIRVGIEKNVSTMKSLSIASYHSLSNYNVLSSYKLCAITHAAGILSNRKKSIQRGFKTKKPYLFTPLLKNCYAFKYLKEMGILKVPLGDKKYFDIMLTRHTMHMLSNANSRLRDGENKKKSMYVRSFTLSSSGNLSICYSQPINEIECFDASGLDRNLDNVTFGNKEEITHFNLSKATKIAECTKNVYSSLKRNDVRIRTKITSKYGSRRKHRVGQLLHKVSKSIVCTAKQKRQAIVLEDIRNIRNLFRKGNGQGPRTRGKMNSWPFGEIHRQIKYKAQWLGVPIIQLTKGETMGTSSTCNQCGKRSQGYKGKDKEQRNLRRRQLYCETCNRWIDRDVNAVINQSIRGLQRLCRSKGPASEAMVQEPDRKELVLLKVDAGKLKIS